MKDRKTVVLTDEQTILLLKAIEFYEETLRGDINYISEEDKVNIYHEINILTDLYNEMIDSECISYVETPRIVIK